jgi:hypothetical protein
MQGDRVGHAQYFAQLTQREGVVLSGIKGIDWQQPVM